MDARCSELWRINITIRSLLIAISSLRKATLSSQQARADLQNGSTIVGEKVFETRMNVVRTNM